MSTPEEEGRKAFMDKLPQDACPYENKKLEVEWKMGYAKQELDELREEQSNALESMTSWSSPYTGLEELIQNLQKSINQYNDLLRSGSLS